MCNVHIFFPTIQFRLFCGYYELLSACTRSNRRNKRNNNKIVFESRKHGRCRRRKRAQINILLTDIIGYCKHIDLFITNFRLALKTLKCLLWVVSVNSILIEWGGCKKTARKMWLSNVCFVTDRWDRKLNLIIVKDKAAKSSRRGIVAILIYAERIDRITAALLCVCIDNCTLSMRYACMLVLHRSTRRIVIRSWFMSSFY